MYKYGIIRHAEVFACILILIVFSALSSGCITESNEQNRDNSSIAIIQTSGETVNLPYVANRIVLLNGNGAEILYLIGAGEKVVGVSNEIAVHPERGKLFPNAVNVGDWMTPNIELISELKPDVIIAFNSMKPKNVDLIEDTGIPIVYIDCYRPTLMAGDVMALGILSGNYSQAEDFVDFYTGIMDNISETTKNISNWPIVYCERTSAYTGMGKGSGMDILLNISGGENVMDVSMGEKGTLSPEWVVTKDPDVIIKTITADCNISYEYYDLISREGFSTMKAVKNNQTWILYNNVAYGPRSFAGAVVVAKMLHPNEFADISVEDLLRDYNDKYGFSFEYEQMYYPNFS